MLYNFLGLVIIAPAKHPIPSRTRPLSAVALMVLRLKTWESKSSPNLVSYITNTLKTIYRLSHPRVAFCVLTARVTLSETLCRTRIALLLPLSAWNHCHVARRGFDAIKCPRVGEAEVNRAAEGLLLQCYNLSPG